jgi:hypothetical protein
MPASDAAAGYYIACLGFSTENWHPKNLIPPPNGSFWTSIYGFGDDFDEDLTIFRELQYTYFQFSSL